MARICFSLAERGRGQDLGARGRVTGVGLALGLLVYGRGLLGVVVKLDRWGAGF